MLAATPVSRKQGSVGPRKMAAEESPFFRLKAYVRFCIPVETGLLLRVWFGHKPDLSGDPRHV